MDNTILKVIILVAAFATKYSECNVVLDQVNSKLLRDSPGSDPCNPLYWYPRNMPAYCYVNTTESVSIPGPIPIPIPVPPLPQPVPLPYGLPIAPSHPMVPVAGAFPPVPQPYPPSLQGPGYPPFLQGPPGYPPYQQGPPGYPPYQQGPSYPQMYSPYRRQQAGMVPGIPGLVSEDGGINILPFSDAYSDIIEKNRNRKLRKRLQRIYDDSRRSYRGHGYYRRRVFY